jgi:O-antigen/teichoic acid export membrane protein
MMLRSALWVFAGRLGNQFVSLLTVMILARLLAPEDFGIVAASQVFLVLSQVVVRFGIGAYLVQADEITPRVVGTAQTFVLGAACAMSAILLYLSQPIGTFMGVPQLPQIMPVLLLNFVLAAAINPAASLLARDMDFKFLARTEVLSQAVGYALVAIALSVLGFGFWAIILGTLAQTLLRAVLVFRRMPVWPALRPDFAVVRPMLAFGGGVFLAQLMSNIAQRADNIVITTTLGTTELGYYSRAYSLMELSNKLLGSVFRETLFSGFSRKRREGLAGQKERAFLMAHAFAALIILPTMVLFFLLSGEIVQLILGNKWGQTVPLIQILALGMFFRLGYKVSGTFILSEGAVYRLATRNLLYAVLVVSCGVVGSSWGVTGVAWGVLGALGLHYVSMTGLALRLSCCSWLAYARAVAPFLVAAGASTAAAWSTGSMLSASPMLRPLVVTAGTASAYVLVLLVLRNVESVMQVRAAVAGLFRMGDVRGRAP